MKIKISRALPFLFLPILLLSCATPEVRHHIKHISSKASPLTYAEAKNQVIKLLNKGGLKDAYSDWTMIPKFKYNITDDGIEFVYQRYINVISGATGRMSASCKFEYIDDPVVVGYGDYLFEVPLGQNCNNLAVYFGTKEKNAINFAEALYALKKKAHLLGADDMLKAGRLNEAIAAAKMVIQLKPESDSAYNVLAQAYGKKKQYAEAIEAYKGAIKFNPKAAQHYSDLGELFFDKGDYKDAVTYLKEALELAPKNLAYLWKLSGAYYLQGRYEDALDVVNRMIPQMTFVGIGARIQIMDNYPTVYSVLGSGPAERAGVKKGDRILEIDGKPVNGWKVDDVVSSLRGQEGTSVTLTIKRDDKVKPFEATIKRETITPKEATAAFAYRSLIKRQLGEKTEALKDAEQARRLDSSDKWAQLVLGAARLDQSRYDEAVGLLSEVKDNTQARILEATAYAKKGDYQKAIDIYTSIEEGLSPKDVPFWDDRNALLRELKPYIVSKRENALRLKAQGRHKEALQELGELMKVVDTEELESICREIAGIMAMDPGLSAIPEEARKYTLRGDVMTEEGKFDEAVKEYRQAVEAAPYIAKLHFNTAMIYGELKKYPQAIRYMKTYLMLAPEAPNARAAKDQIYKWEFMMEKGE